MIGVFDSGIGGLTVVKELFNVLPEYKIIYFGDTARLPYGTKSPELIKKFSKEIVNFLLKKGAKVIIIACHTSSSIATDFLRKNFKNIPIFEMTDPAIKEVLKISKDSKNKNIGVIGTPATIKSQVYNKKLLHRDNTLKIYSQSCPLFVPLVEEGWIDTKETKEIARKYLSGLQKKKISSLVLGCTHYPVLKNIISEIIGEKVAIINPGKDLVIEFKNFLENNKKIEKSLKKGKGSHQFFVSDNPYNFKIMSKLCLGKEINAKIIK